MQVFYWFYSCWLNLEENKQNELLGNIFTIDFVAVSSIKVFKNYINFLPTIFLTIFFCLCLWDLFFFFFANENVYFLLNHLSEIMFCQCKESLFCVTTFLKTNYFYIKKQFNSER